MVPPPPPPNETLVPGETMPGATVKLGRGVYWVSIQLALSSSQSFRMMTSFAWVLVPHLLRFRVAGEPPDP